MSEKLKKIIEIANDANHSNEVEIWTNSFRARGIIVKEPGRTVDGIISLADARIIPFITDIENSVDIILHNWLNIFEDQIIAFTVLRR